MRSPQPATSPPRSEPDAALQRIARLAAQMWGTRYALIRLADRDGRWSQNCYGSAPEDPDADRPFCSHAVAATGVVMAPDTSQDVRFADLPGVRNYPGIRFYAGTALRSPAGTRLGAICVLDDQPRDPPPDGCAGLADLAALAVDALEQRRLMAQLHHMVRHDSLTGLPNRVYLAEWLPQAMAQAAARNQSLAVAFLDLDRFKQINDTLGHTIGDALLQQVGLRLKSALREGDSLARMGGDEFTIVLTGLPPLGEPAVSVGCRLLDILRVPFHVSGYELYVTASVGISIYPKDGRNAASLLSKADSAMYGVKNVGKNGLACFKPEISASAIEQLELETALRHALEKGQFRLDYQPQMDMEGRLAGLEVLLAWRHPRIGRVPAERFIPIAEESGLIVPIGEWVLTQACLQGFAWQKAGYAPVKIAVNVSALQFGRPDFVGTVSRALEQSGLEPRFLELEVTESLVMNNVDEAARRMASLRALGISISIDDFGTGYSSLSYLRHLPADTLKIDQSFLHELDDPGSALPLVQTIVSLAHNLGLCVIAEGVETARQLELLREAGCDLVQGHFFGAGLDAGSVENLLGEKAGREA